MKNLYLEVIPGSAEYNLDNITMETVNEENWEQEANERIEILRKRNVTIYFDYSNDFTTEGSMITLLELSLVHLIEIFALEVNIYGQ